MPTRTTHASRSRPRVRRGYTGTYFMYSTDLHSSLAFTAVNLFLLVPCALYRVIDTPDFRVQISAFVDGVTEGTAWLRIATWRAQEIPVKSAEAIGRILLLNFSSLVGSLCIMDGVTETVNANVYAVY